MERTQPLNDQPMHFVSTNTRAAWERYAKNMQDDNQSFMPFEEWKTKMDKHDYNMLVLHADGRRD